MSTWFPYALAAPVSVLALFYVGRDIYWLFRPQSSPGARGLANGWDEGFDAGVEAEGGHIPTSNPYREVK